MTGITPQVDKAEVLRYLGHRGQAYGEGLDRTIDSAIATCLELARPKAVHRRFGLLWREDSVGLAGTQLALTGGSIRAHLEGADHCVLLAVTLGVGLETRIRAMEAVDLTFSLALDAAATACVESACDQAGEAVAAEATEESRFSGERFSPGYGDLPLELQPGILRLLDAERRIGLTCTESLILLPRKSVTAVIGLHDRPVRRQRPGCTACSLRERCDFRRCSQGS